MVAGFDPQAIQDIEGARKSIRALLNLVEEMQSENQRLRQRVGELLTDDAPQFNHLTPLHALCWVHEGRAYTKLTPIVAHHQQLLTAFRQQFWAFYHQLNDYRDAPDPACAVSLRQRFDELFSTVTGYAQLDQRIASTRVKQQHLLLVLDYPFLPLHNNPAELGVRQRVRKRDISFGPRSLDAVAAWDTFMTLTETAKKLGVSFSAYVFDRISKSYRLPSLADLIQTHSQSAPLQPVPIYSQAG